MEYFRRRPTRSGAARLGMIAVLALTLSCADDAAPAAATRAEGSVTRSGLAPTADTEGGCESCAVAAIREDTPRRYDPHLYLPPVDVEDPAEIEARERAQEENRRAE